jgi:hypothetical protein
MLSCGGGTFSIRAAPHVLLTLTRQTGVGFAQENTGSQTTQVLRNDAG